MMPDEQNITKIDERDRLRILLLGDASNYHRCLAIGLRRLGHDVTVASDGSRWMNTDRDIDLSRPLPGKAGGLMLWLKIKRLLSTRLAGYDVVSINGTCFASLRPTRLSVMFDSLLRNNRSVFISALGTDSRYVEVCTGSNPPLRYDEWQINGTPSPHAVANRAEIDRWLAPDLSTLCNKIYDKSAGTVTALYEYDEVCRTFLPADRVAYGGIPVDTKAIEYFGPGSTYGKVRLFLGRHADRTIEKGTDRLFEISKRVVAAHPDACALDIVENVPYAEYLDRLRSADIVLDQLYSYTPATNALLAMAMGKTVVSGGEPEYYDFIGEHDNRPIINAIPDDDDALFRAIEDAVMRPSALADRGMKSRDFSIRHNDTEIVARRFVDFWRSKI
ncbi:MAG: hypothetical protein K2L73_00740 [Muribaculaceae bacterium]|nr:hypothetical protein [Muribaculaceae bacterium]